MKKLLTVLLSIIFVMQPSYAMVYVSNRASRVKDTLTKKEKKSTSITTWVIGATATVSTALVLLWIYVANREGSTQSANQPVIEGQEADFSDRAAEVRRRKKEASEKLLNALKEPNPETDSLETLSREAFQFYVCKAIEEAAENGKMNALSVLVHHVKQEHIESIIEKGATRGSTNIVRSLAAYVSQYTRSEIIKEAAKEGNLDIIQCAIDKSSSSTRNPAFIISKNCALKAAVIQGHLGIVKFFLEEENEAGQPHVNSEYFINEFLKVAAKNGRLEIVKLFTEGVNKEGKCHVTNQEVKNEALKEAVGNSKVNIVVFLLGIRNGQKTHVTLEGIQHALNEQNIHNEIKPLLEEAKARLEKSGE